MLYKFVIKLASASVWLNHYEESSRPEVIAGNILKQPYLTVLNRDGEATQVINTRDISYIEWNGMEK